VTLTEFDLSELLAALKAGDMTDPMSSSLEWVLQQLIEAEATAFVGAGPHERTATRVLQRALLARLVRRADGDLRPPSRLQGAIGAVFVGASWQRVLLRGSDTNAVATSERSSRHPPTINPRASSTPSHARCIGAHNIGASPRST
jgi:hypothetical protein